MNPFVIPNDFGMNCTRGIAGCFHTMNKMCGRQVIRMGSSVGQGLAAEPVGTTLAVPAHAAGVVPTNVTTNWAVSTPYSFSSRSVISSLFWQVGCVAGMYSAARPVQPGNFDTSPANNISRIYRELQDSPWHPSCIM